MTSSSGVSPVMVSLGSLQGWIDGWVSTPKGSRPSSPESPNPEDTRNPEDTNALVNAIETK